MPTRSAQHTHRSSWFKSRPHEWRAPFTDTPDEYFAGLADGFTSAKGARVFNEPKRNRRPHGRRPVPHFQKHCLRHRPPYRPTSISTCGRVSDGHSLNGIVDQAIFGDTLRADKEDLMGANAPLHHPPRRRKVSLSVPRPPDHLCLRDTRTARIASHRLLSPVSRHLPERSHIPLSHLLPMFC